MARPQDNIRDGLIAVAIIVTFAIAIVLAFDIPASVERLAVFVALITGLVIFSRQAGDVTVGFIIVTTGLLAVLIEYVIPGFIVEPFQAPAAVVVDLLGFDPFSQINSLHLFVLSVAFVAVMLGLRIRLTGQRKFLPKIVDLVLKEFARYWENYVTIGRLIAVFGIGVLAIILEQTANFSGAVGDVIAQAPIVVSNMVAVLAGYLSLGGELPYIGTIPLLGSLTAIEYAILGLAILFVAAASRYDGSGPLANFLRR